MTDHPPAPSIPALDTIYTIASRESRRANDGKSMRPELWGYVVGLCEQAGAKLLTAGSVLRAEGQPTPASGDAPAASAVARTGETLKSAWHIVVKLRAADSSDLAWSIIRSRQMRDLHAALDKALHGDHEPLAEPPVTAAQPTILKRQRDDGSWAAEPVKAAETPKKDEDFWTDRDSVAEPLTPARSEEPPERPWCGICGRVLPLLCDECHRATDQSRPEQDHAAVVAWLDARIAQLEADRPRRAGEAFSDWQSRTSEPYSLVRWLKAERVSGLAQRAEEQG